MVKACVHAAVCSSGFTLLPALCEVMGIFPCPCCTYVTCVDLILPWCDPPTANVCRWAAHLGTPCGLPEHSQIRGTCICQLDPTSMGRSEPQDSLCFSGDQTWNRPPWLTAFCAPWGNLPDPSSLPFPCSLQPPPGSLPSLPTAVQHTENVSSPTCPCVHVTFHPHRHPRQDRT